MVIRFVDDICDESVNDLVSVLEAHEQVDLFFSTNGGSVLAMSSLIHYLNKRKEEVRIFLDFVCSSSGAMLFTHYAGAIMLTPTFECAFLHRWDARVYKFRNDDPYFDAGVPEKQWEGLWKNNVNTWKSAGLDKKAIKKLLDNKPHYVYRKDFRKLSLPAQILFS